MHVDFNPILSQSDVRFFRVETRLTENQRLHCFIITTIDIVVMADTAFRFTHGARTGDENHSDYGTDNPVFENNTEQNAVNALELHIPLETITDEQVQRQVSTVKHV